MKGRLLLAFAVLLITGKPAFAAEDPLLVTKDSSAEVVKTAVSEAEKQQPAPVKISCFAQGAMNQAVFIRFTNLTRASWWPRNIDVNYEIRVSEDDNIRRLRLERAGQLVSWADGINDFDLNFSLRHSRAGRMDIFVPSADAPWIRVDVNRYTVIRNGDDFRLELLDTQVCTTDVN